jgi:hypothetical protein
VVRVGSVEGDGAPPTCRTRLSTSSSSSGRVTGPAPTASAFPLFKRRRHRLEAFDFFSASRTSARRAMEAKRDATQLASDASARLAACPRPSSTPSTPPCESAASAAAAAVATATAAASRSRGSRGARSRDSAVEASEVEGAGKALRHEQHDQSPRRDQSKVSQWPKWRCEPTRCLYSRPQREAQSYNLSTSKLQSVGLILPYFCC